MTNKIQTTAAENSRTLVRAGFVYVCLLFAAGLILQILRGYDGMESDWIFTAGMDVICLAVCGIIYYSNLQSSEHIEEYTILFSSLLTANAAGLFLDECCWLVQGVPSLALWNRIANALFYANNCTIIYMFWRYACDALGMNVKLQKKIKSVLIWIFAAASVVSILNIFFPIYFSVDENGVYRREPLFFLCMLFLVIVIPFFIAALVTSKATLKEKLVICSFVLIPIIAEVISVTRFGVSAQQAAVLMSILLIYGVLVAEREKKLKLTQTELNMASQIQASMMPSTFPAFPDRSEFDIYATMEPAKEVGGDFYDFFLIDEDHLCLLIADVSGKGVPASLFMMASKIIIASCAMLGSSAAEILTKTNEAICSNNKKEMFVTVWLGILEISTGRITAANAGHEYPVIGRAGGAFEVLKDRHGLVIGAMEGVKYKEYELSLSPGDKLFIYTDGVPEATDAENGMFGMERMVTALNEAKDAAPKDVLEKVRQRVSGFVENAQQFDDLTMLCLEYKGSKAKSGAAAE